MQVLPQFPRPLEEPFKPLLKAANVLWVHKAVSEHCPDNPYNEPSTHFLSPIKPLRAVKLLVNLTTGTGDKVYG